MDSIRARWAAVLGIATGLLTVIGTIVVWAMELASLSAQRGVIIERMRSDLLVIRDELKLQRERIDRLERR